VKKLYRKVALPFSYTWNTQAPLREVHFFNLNGVKKFLSRIGFFCLALFFLLGIFSIFFSSKAFARKKMDESTQSAVSESKPLGKARVRQQMRTTKTACLYKEITPAVIREDGSYTPKNYPTGPVIAELYPNSIVEVLKIFLNNAESKYTFQIRTSSDLIGFVIADEIELINEGGDKHNWISLIISEPYEYECICELYG